MSAPDRKQLVGLLTTDPQLVLEEGAQVMQLRTARGRPRGLDRPCDVVLLQRGAGALDRAGAGRRRPRAHRPDAVVPRRAATCRCKVTSPVFFDPEGERLEWLICPLPPPADHYRQPDAAAAAAGRAPHPARRAEVLEAAGRGARHYRCRCRYAAHRSRRTRAALWLGPDERLLLVKNPRRSTPPGCSRPCKQQPHSLVDVSHRQVALAHHRSAGRHRAGSRLPAGPGPGAFPVGMCTRTVLAKAEIVLWRRAEQRFHLEVWRSFAAYVSGVLAEASRELAATGRRLILSSVASGRGADGHVRYQHHGRFRSSPLPTHFGFLTLRQFSMIAFTNAIEPLRMANPGRKQSIYRWSVYTFDGQPVPASNGLTVAQTARIDESHLPDITVCLRRRRRPARSRRRGAAAAASHGPPAHRTRRHCAPAPMRWPRPACSTATAAPFIGKISRRLRETFPQTEFTPDLFVVDRDRCTCTGGIAPLDLMLHLITPRIGKTLAAGISDQFILERVRGGGSPAAHTAGGTTRRPSPFSDPGRRVSWKPISKNRYRSMNWRASPKSPNVSCSACSAATWDSRPRSTT
jgi:heterotetrameric sarcosine oxidase gamma subunit